MIIFFWQNCISPHQVPYICKVAEDERVEKVYLIAPRVDYEERKEMGWKSDILIEGLDMEVYITPDKKRIDALMQMDPEHAVHLFSGIRGDYGVFQYFLQSLKYHLKRGFIIEPPYTYDKPLWAHYVRFFLQDWKYIGYFDYVFAIGEDAVRYYRHWSDRWKVVPFVYCTEIPKLLPSGLLVTNTLSMVFVGSLSKRKDVKTLLKVFLLLPQDMEVTLDIYGDGEQREVLEKMVQGNSRMNRITFHGRIEMRRVTEVMQQYDILVLPSLYDGWGAVVNEALMCGLYVVCSNRCGARALLGPLMNGSTFRSGDSDDLYQLIRYCYRRRLEIKGNREARRQWSKCISGTSVARYMLDNLTTKNLITEPWAE